MPALCCRKPLRTRQKIVSFVKSTGGRSRAIAVRRASIQRVSASVQSRSRGQPTSPPRRRRPARPLPFLRNPTLACPGKNPASYQRIPSHPSNSQLERVHGTSSSRPPRRRPRLAAWPSRLHPRNPLDPRRDSYPDPGARPAPHRPAGGHVHPLGRGPPDPHPGPAHPHPGYHAPGLRFAARIRLARSRAPAQGLAPGFRMPGATTWRPGRPLAPAPTRRCRPLHAPVTPHLPPCARPSPRKVSKRSSGAAPKHALNVPI